MLTKTSKYLLIFILIFNIFTTSALAQTSTSSWTEDTRQWTATSTRTQTETHFNDWEIQSIDDENVMISVAPKYLYGSGWVYLNITSKRYTGIVDIVFGFDSEAVRPTSIFYKNIQEEWMSLSDSFTKVNFDHLGMDTWYYASRYVSEDRLYELRYYVDMKYTQESSPLHKYFVALKPHFETLQEARDNGHLYVLDPWWDNSFTRKAEWTADLSGYSETHTNVTLTLEIPYDADMQVDFDDIRFVDSDDSTQLDAYLVDKTDSTNAWVKVRIPSLTTGGTYTIYMYYGNGGAASDWCDSEDAWDDEYEGIWTFHETSGSVLDLSKNSLDLLPQGSPDQSGTMEPDGSDLGAGAGSGDYYTTGDNAAYDPLTDPYIAMWFGQVYDTTTEGKLMGHFDGGGNYPGWDIANEDNTGKVKTYWRTSGVAYTILTGTTNIFGKTSSVFGVRNVTGDTIHIFVNGTSDVAAVTDNTVSIDSSLNMSVLARGNGAYPSKGNVTEARVYRGEMTPERIEIEHKLMLEDLFTLQLEYVFTAVTGSTTVVTTVTTTVGTTVSTNEEGTTIDTVTDGTSLVTSTINSSTTIGTYTISNDIIITVDETVTVSEDVTVSHKTASTVTENSTTTVVQITTYTICSTYSESQASEKTLTSTQTTTVSDYTVTTASTVIDGTTQVRIGFLLYHYLSYDLSWILTYIFEYPRFIEEIVVFGLGLVIFGGFILLATRRRRRR